jgi:hypothetical protein
VTGREIRLHPVIARDLAELTALLGDFLNTSGAARAALSRYTAARPGYATTQIIADLLIHAADLRSALNHSEGTRP